MLRIAAVSALLMLGWTCFFACLTSSRWTCRLSGRSVVVVYGLLIKASMRRTLPTTVLYWLLYSDSGRVSRCEGKCIPYGTETVSNANFVGVWRSYVMSI